MSTFLSCVEVIEEPSPPPQFSMDLYKILPPELRSMTLTHLVFKPDAGSRRRLVLDDKAIVQLCLASPAFVGDIFMVAEHRRNSSDRHPRRHLSELVVLLDILRPYMVRHRVVASSTTAANYRPTEARQSRRGGSRESIHPSEDNVAGHPAIRPPHAGDTARPCLSSIPGGHGDGDGGSCGTSERQARGGHRSTPSFGTRSRSGFEST